MRARSERGRRHWHTGKRCAKGAGWGGEVLGSGPRQGNLIAGTVDLGGRLDRVRERLCGTGPRDGRSGEAVIAMVVELGGLPKRASVRSNVVAVIVLPRDCAFFLPPPTTLRRRNAFGPGIAMMRHGGQTESDAYLGRDTVRIL